jgi:KRAB domain-containing zinc finger protein
LNDTCAQLFDKPVDYILHARIHSQKRYFGGRRPARFKYMPSNNNIHRRRKRTHRCSICKKLFPSAESLQHHSRFETHTFDCQLCPAVFDSNNSYHNHIAQHGEIRLYRCTVCIESFQKRTDLSRHVLTKHNEDLPKQKSCSTCKLTFKTTFHLNRHNVTKHSDIKPFKCEENGCQQAFAR